DNHRVFFAMRVDAPYTASTADGQPLDAGGTASGEALKLVLDFPGDFPDGPDAPLQAKIAISYTDVDGARRNLDAEIPHWDFDAARTEARAKWEGELARVQVDGGSGAQR